MKWSYLAVFGDPGHESREKVAVDNLQIQWNLEEFKKEPQEIRISDSKTSGNACNKVEIQHEKKDERPSPASLWSDSVFESEEDRIRRESRMK